MEGTRIMSGRPTRTTWKEERRLLLLKYGENAGHRGTADALVKRNEFDFSLIYSFGQ